MSKNTDLAKLIYSKLKSLSIAKKRPMQEVLRYYSMERFLYRLSISSHKNSFFLKGGLLLMIWNPKTYRATMDIDLLAKTKNSPENLSRIIKEICSIYHADGIEFDSNLNIAKTQLGAKYKGLVVKFYARLFTAKIPLQIDIGFSDKILPEPCSIKYPSLMELPLPELQAYTPETSIAEKFHAIVKLGFANTRMKDFYDAWVIIHQLKISPEQFKPVLLEVFQNRKTSIANNPHAFSVKFYTNPRTLGLWSAFLREINHEFVPFDRVISDLKQFFLPLLETKN